MSEYFLVLLICICIPLWQSFNKRWGLRGRFSISIKSILITSVPFIIWDIIVTDIGHWHFNPDFIQGWFFFNLPVEEVLFFFVVPFCCVFSWNAFKTLEKK
jgi:lycopene cyclase domain-containing protein